MSTSPYSQAGKTLTQLLSGTKNGGNDTKKSGLKNLAFHPKTGELRITKSSYAQVCNALRYKTLIDEVLNSDGGKLRKAVKLNEARDKGLVYVLIYELLFGKYKGIRGGGAVKRNIMKFEAELKETKAKVLKDRGDDSESEGGRRVVFPRYVRVNTLKCSTAEALSELRPILDADGGNDAEGALKGKLYADPHVPNLLVLPPLTNINSLARDIIKEGKVVLQDKSSCFSALALVHGGTDGKFGEEGNGDYIDACAAPGNKTSHLAALIAEARKRRQEGERSQTDGKNDSKEEAMTPRKKKKRSKNAPGNASAPAKMFAFDRSSARIQILRNRLETLVPTSSAHVEVHPVHFDFLKVDPSEPKYKNVRGILLDPSCSGSGVVNSPDRIGDTMDGDEEDAEEGGRLDKLSNFQLLALKHAMTFPQLRRIVYSTCSVHDVENECVVGQALREYNDGRKEDSSKWRVRRPKCLDHWVRRGRKGIEGGLDDEEADCCLRVDGLDGDETNGFFVCYLERGEDDGGGERSMDSDGKTVKANLTEGVAIYDGEFASRTEAISSGKKKTTEKASPELAPANKAEGAKTKSHVAKTTATTAAPDNKSKGKIAKKREKKLAWKRKQMEQKRKRLEAKKLKETLPSQEE